MTIPNQYDDAFFKSQLEDLINRKMVDIVRVANEECARCEEYKAIEMPLPSGLAFAPRSSCKVGPRREAWQGEWCEETQILQPRRVRQSSRSRRSLCQAWGEKEALQLIRVRQSSPTRRSLSQAWGDSEVLQPRWVRQSCRTRWSLCQAWCEETKAESVTSMGR